MRESERVLYEAKTKFEHYQVVELIYTGRKARVLFSGERAAAQSGLPLDNNPDMLFDYNQRFLELVQSLRPLKILLIGGGTFTLPSKIVEDFPDVEVDVVERDPELLEIAKRFFKFKASKRLKVITGDGREYLAQTKKSYDLIIIDAFVHNVIPPALTTQEFIKLLQNGLSKNGVVATNIISAYHGLGDNVLKQQYTTYKSVFRHVDIFPADRVLSYWISQNFILASTNKRLKPKYQLRFEGLKPPPTKSDDILLDNAW